MDYPINRCKLPKFLLNYEAEYLLPYQQQYQMRHLIIHSVNALVIIMVLQAYHQNLTPNWLCPIAILITMLVRKASDEILCNASQQKIWGHRRYQNYPAHQQMDSDTKMVAPLKPLLHNKRYRHVDEIYQSRHQSFL